MIQTTFRELHKTGACKKRYKHLAKALGGIQKYGRNTSITLLQILDINGLDDALWALRACDDAEKFCRLLACDYAEHVLSIWEAEYPDDNRPRKAIETARRYVNGEATDDELTTAWAAAETAAWAVARDISDAAWNAVWDAIRAAASDVVWNVTWDVPCAARDAAADAAGDAAGDAAKDIAWNTECKWQEERLREMLKEMEAK